MNKLKYYNKLTVGNKRHEILIGSWGIRKRFQSYADAETLSTALQQDLASLKLLFKRVDMDAAKFSIYPYSMEDMERYEQSGLSLHPFIEDAIAGSRGTFNGRIPISIRNPTIGEMITGYAEWLDGGNAIKKFHTLPPLKRANNGDLPARFRFWQECALADVRASNIDALDLEKEICKVPGLVGMANNTYNRYIYALAAGYTFAMMNTKCDIVKNVALKMKFKSIADVQNTMSYSRAEIREIVRLMYAEDARIHAANTMEKRWGPEGFCQLGPLVYCAALTGIRESFIQSLRKDEVILDSGRMFIQKAMKGQKIVKVPLLPEACDLLRKQQLKPEVIASDYMFPYKGGFSKGWYNRFREVLDVNDLKISPKPFHSLRSYAATQYAINDFGEPLIALILGVSEKVAHGYIDRHQIDDDFEKKAALVPRMMPAREVSGIRLMEDQDAAAGVEEEARQ